MKSVLLAALFVLLTIAAQAQTTGCLQGSPYNGTAAPSGCSVSDWTIGPPVSSTDSFAICQQGAGNCKATSPNIMITQVPMSAVSTYIRSTLSATPPLTYNSSTGAFGCSTFGTSAAGCVPASGGGTSNYLRADGTWAPTSGSGGGTVTSVAAGTGLSASPSPIVGAGTMSCVNFSSTLVGCVPASGGGTTNFLRADGTWAAPPGGTGGGTFNLGPGLAQTATVTTYNPGTQTVTGGQGISRQLFPDPHTTSCTVNSTCGSTNDAGKLLIANGPGVTFTVPTPGAAGTAGFTFGRDANADVYSLTVAGSTIYGCGTTGATVSISPAIDVNLTSDGTNWHCTPFGGTGGGGGGATSVWTGTVGGTSTAYTSTPIQSGFTNTAYNMFCGIFNTASTGLATLAVSPGAALPIMVQSSNSVAAQAGAGDISGGGVSICLQLDASATHWIKKDVIPGSINKDLPTHTVTASEWSSGAVFIYTTGAASLTFPAVSTLSAQGGIIVSTVSGVVLTYVPNAVDGINGLPINTSMVSNTGLTSLVSTSGTSGVGALIVPLGETKIYPFSWGPGMNLSTVPVPLLTRGTQTPAVLGAINCTVGGAVSGTATVDIWMAADTVAPTSGTKLTATSCNAAGTANTLQPTLQIAGTTLIPMGYHLWAVAAGAGWASGATSASGEIQVGVSP